MSWAGEECSAGVDGQDGIMPAPCTHVPQGGGPTLRGQQHRANAFRQWPPPDQVRVLGKREGEGAQEERRKVTLALLPVLPLSP